MGLKFFDFFAGIGGFRLGMEQAGHECVGHCEIDKYANMSYNAMHKPKESEVYFDDIRTVGTEDMPEADVYCFGFPCQTFSIIGSRRGFNDIRGTLFFEVMRLAAVRKPKILFAENVAGLLSHDHGRTFAVIINTMAELGYFVEWQIINSKYYVPQNRERVFIVGHLGNESGGKVFPITGNDKLFNELRSEKTGLKTADFRYDEGLRIRKAPIVPTLTASIKNCPESFSAIPYIINDEKNGTMIRKTTPKECFRLQGFPDEYFERAAAVCSENQLYKQAGNSVTVNVIYEIAKRLKV